MRSRPLSCAHRAFAALTLITAAALTACGAADEGADDAALDLTSNTGAQRSLTFQGMFYVPTGTSNATVAAQAALQAKAAFGALRTSNMVAASRYMTGIVPGSIKRLTVNVIDTTKPAGTRGTSAVRVTYMYKDAAVVPKTMTSSVFATALLNPRYDSLQSVIRKNCTPGETETGEPIWYSLDTSGAACQADISAEADKIQADRTHLPPPASPNDASITLSELQRVFFPTAFALGSQTTNTETSYPEYDQLYSGQHGVEAGKLVVGMIAGYATHKALPAEAKIQGKFLDASGAMTVDGYIFQNFINAVLTATAANANFASTSNVDLAFAVNGRAYSFANLLTLARFVSSPGANPPVTSASAGDQATDFNALMQQIMDRVSKRWLTFEAPATVASGSTSHPLTLKLQAYFGTDEENVAVFKTAFKHNDVLGYMGHSYTGHGPYAPQNLVASDFASGYQLMFFNGCVSYNYYDQSFFKLKAGGTKKLDLVTNSIEGLFSTQEGTFAAAFLDGSLPSYAQLLKRLEDPKTSYGSGANVADDPFRVVDGELDNTYAPSATPIKIH